MLLTAIAPSANAPQLLRHRARIAPLRCKEADSPAAAPGTVIGALVSGKLADRYGAAEVLLIALTVFGAGLALGTFTRSVVLLGAVFPVIALSGGAAIALPYALLMNLMPSRSHGAVAGLFDVSSGVGTLLGPTITGAAIDLLRPFFRSTHGYGAMWPVRSISILASTVVLRRASALAQNHDGGGGRYRRHTGRWRTNSTDRSA